MVPAHQTDTNDTSPADTTDVFCSSNSTLRTSNQDEISKMKMVGTNEETNSSQNVKICSTENVTDDLCYRGNHEASASEKTQLSK
jgi:hypothetical protein